ncbi:pumilio domain member 6 [Chytridiales sp. JEL 0842]|nr:pumilio domain member 6 [Chytridiales sp. JEL 0842]
MTTKAKSSALSTAASHKKVAKKAAAPTAVSKSKKNSPQPSKPTVKKSNKNAPKSVKSSKRQQQDEEEDDDDDEDVPDQIDWDALPDAESEEGDWSEGDEIEMDEGDDLQDEDDGSDDDDDEQVEEESKSSKKKTEKNSAKMDVDEEDDEAEEDEGDGWEVGSDDEQEEGGDEEEADEDDEDVPAKKARTAEEEEKQKLSREEQKKLLKERKMAKPHGTLISQCKKIWETLRLKKIEPKVRQEHMRQLMELITGHVHEITFKHDAARMIQCAVKYGNQEQRDIIAKELKGSYLTLMKSQYGKFIVSKILNYCPKYRGDVITEMYGKVRKLMRHRDAALVVEEAYSQFANATQRTALMEEFYSPEFALFKTGGIRTLQTLLTSQPEKKPLILKHLRETLDSFLEKGAANIGPHTIIHRALLDYLLIISNDLTSTSACTDMVELLKDHLVAILHTREGARVAQLTILLSTPKDRKHILKSFKGLIPKIAQEQYGHTVLLTLLDAVDDTVLVGKSVLAELLKPTVGATDASEVQSPSQLFRDRYASRVLLFALVGRNRKYQPAYVMNEMAETDSIKSRTSKKDTELRLKEIKNQLVAAGVLDVAVKNAAGLVRSRWGSQVIYELLNNDPVPEASELFNTLASLIEGTAESHASTENSNSSAEQTKKKGLGDQSLKTLAAEMKKAKEESAAASGNPTESENLQMESHVLLHRVANSTLKLLLRPSPPLTALEGLKLDFARNVAGKLRGKGLEYWVGKCVEDPLHTSGTCFFLSTLMETGDEEVVKALMLDAEKAKGLLKELEGAVGKVKKEREEGSKGEKAGKRKRGGEKEEKEGEREKGGVVAVEVLKEQFQKLCGMNSGL